MKYLLKICFIFCFSTLFSQSGDSLKFDFFNSSVKLYAIGEDHFEDDIQLQVSIIEYLQNNTNIDVFIFEYPIEVGKIFNEYILFGHKKEEVDKICSLLNKNVSRKTKIILDFLKNHNLSNSNKIEVKGIDRLSFYKLKRQLSSLLIIFPELKQIDLPKNERYVLKHKVKDYNQKKSGSIINSLITELQDNRSSFDRSLGAKLIDYEKCLNDLKLYYMDYGSRVSDSIRETFMTQNLINIVDSNSVSILICGGLHAMYKEKDTWYYGYPFTSMVASIKMNYPSQVFSIVLQYHEKKLFRFFPEFNLLSDDLELSFKECNKQYEVVTGKELTQHPYANERCDMIIIQNNKYRKRKAK